MENVILLTRTLICAISMALTGLFAISFTQPSESLSFTHTLNIALLISIGMCLDLCKFLFWRFQKTNMIYMALSLALMGFSCVASIAFFVSNESTAISNAQRLTPEHRAHTLKIEQLQREIKQNENLAETRANSQYHEQWDKSQLLRDKIHHQTQQLSALIASSNHIGVSSARSSLPSSAFFLKVANALNTTFERIVIVAYSLLAIFIEISALGLISLSSHARAHPKVSASADEEPHHTHAGDFEPVEYSVEKKLQGELQTDDPMTQIDRVKQDLHKGTIAPHIRQITSHYGIERGIALQILHQLVDEGFLEKRGVRFYTTGS